MNRHNIRQVIFYGVFVTEFYESADVPTVFDEILSDPLIYEDMETAEPNEADLDFIRVRFKDYLAHASGIDELISEKMVDWRISRIGKVELAAIRLAVYEFLYDDEVPKKVVINEAVELSKEFGGESSGGFVNGALSRIMNS